MSRLARALRDIELRDLAVTDADRLGRGRVPFGEESRVGAGTDLAPLPPDALRHRDILYQGGAWYYRCRVDGYLSRKQDFQWQAEFTPCPICVVMDESRERERKLHGE